MCYFTYGDIDPEDYAENTDQRSHCGCFLFFSFKFSLFTSVKRLDYVDYENYQKNMQRPDLIQNSNRN